MATLIVFLFTLVIDPGLPLPHLKPHHQNSPGQNQGNPNYGERAKSTLSCPEKADAVEDKPGDELTADHQRERPRHPGLTSREGDPTQDKRAKQPRDRSVDHHP